MKVQEIFFDKTIDLFDALIIYFELERLWF